VAGDRSDDLLTGARIRSLLLELAEELVAIGETGELFVVGGAALALGYEARESTRDVDALFEPKVTIYEAAARVGDRAGIGAGWLNDAMKGFLHGADSDRRLVLDHAGLRVYVASPRYLLAMQLLAGRVERDADDIVLLLDLAGITDVDEALSLVEDAYGRDRIPVKTSLLLEAILSTES
jgi:hypothetical protein